MDELFSIDSEEMINRMILFIPSWMIKNNFYHEQVLELHENYWWPKHSREFDLYTKRYSAINDNLLKFEAENLSISNYIYFLGSKIPILKLKNSAGYKLQDYFHEHEMENKKYSDYYDANLDKKFNEFYYILYINWDNVIKPIFQIINDCDYENEKNILKKYISEVDYWILKNNVIKSYLTNLGINNYEDVTSDILREIGDYKIKFNCAGLIWDEVNDRKEIITELTKDLKKALVKNDKHCTSIIFYDWASLIRYEMLHLFKKKRMCANLKCKRVLGPNEGKYCKDNMECKRSRDRARKNKQILAKN